ncbi:HD domain-containing protein [Xanthovirga aplysinae]|uniref:HD domain-containing protein n=1 Tax=Xanthovirga aplysinae TaxID=2529853 RepID=UPI001656BF49|nr:HD domain-containing protein [Xanthovirga aplysinae]
MNKNKVINDPVYGFVTVYSDLIFDIIEHPFFQRLRRISQLGLTSLIYPGALHTRFHHALGAMHLMSITLDNLRNKGNEISDEEYEGALLAILLHDIGHGPFSHALEDFILPGFHHEKLSLLLMEYFNKVFDGALDRAIQIFRGTYERRFFHQLVSSQLDIDRLDYLMRDSFFTGVSEGTIGADRIIKMLDVYQDQIVVEEKGIYSIENLLSARRLMYWQVYLHKATVSSEKMLVQLILRVRDLLKKGMDVWASPALKLFLTEMPSPDQLKENERYLKTFAALDDFDIWGALKVWVDHRDPILSKISQMLLNRKLFKVLLSNEKFSINQIEEVKERVKQTLGLKNEEVKYFVSHGAISNAAYIAKGQNINILTKNGQLVDIALASDLPNIKAMSKIVKKYYLCWPKNVSL